MSITIGVTEWTIDKKGVEAIARAKQLGFEALQIRLYSLETLEEYETAAMQVKFNKTSVAHNIPIIGMSAGLFGEIAMHDVKQEHYIISLWERIIKFALALNISLVYAPSFGASLMKTSQDITQTSIIFRRACNYIGDRQLLLATENSLSTVANRKLIEQIDHPNMRILMDAYNPVNYGYKAADQLRELADVVANQFHAKDGTKAGNALLTKGTGDFLATVQALKDINFIGYIICENDYSTNTNTRTAADIVTLKRLWP